MNNSSIVLGVGMGMVWAATSASAALVAYEGFDYPAGSTIYGAGADGIKGNGDDVRANGGTGWTQAWGQFNGNSDLSAGNSTSGLSMTGFFPSSGVSAQPTGYNTAARNFTTTNYTSGALYFSTLIRTDASNATNEAFVVRLFAVDQNTGGNVSFGIRAAGGGPIPFISSNGYMTVGAQGSAIAGGTEHLLVAKYDVAAKTMSLFVDPAPNAAEPATPTLTYTYGSGAGATTVGRLVLASDGGQTLNVDEIRIGTEYGDVVPVPEPASVAASVIAAAGLSFRRRRRT